MTEAIKYVEFADHKGADQHHERGGDDSEECDDVHHTDTVQDEIACSGDVSLDVQKTHDDG